MVQKVFVKVAYEDEVSSLLFLAYQYKTLLTFRTLATSLSWKAIVGSLLDLLMGNLTDIRVKVNGERINLESGKIEARSNDI